MLISRATGLRAMLRDEFEERRVCKVSGHKAIQNLSSYHSLTEVDKMKMAISIQHGHESLDTGTEIKFNNIKGPIENGCVTTSDTKLGHVSLCNGFLEEILPSTYVPYFEMK